LDKCAEFIHLLHRKLKYLLTKKIKVMFKNLFKTVQDLVGGNDEPKKGYDAEEGVYYAKGSFDDEVEYNNEIICITNGNHDNMDDMNDAMDDKDYARAEKVRLQWKEDVKTYKEQVRKLGPYKGDTMLMDAAIAFLDEYDRLMDNGYKVLIEMRAAGKRGTPEEQAQLKNNNNLIQRFTDKLNEVSDDFLEKYEDD
jgi:hypothetical protein